LPPKGGDKKGINIKEAKPIYPSTRFSSRRMERWIFLSVLHRGAMHVHHRGLEKQQPVVSVHIINHASAFASSAGASIDLSIKINSSITKSLEWIFASSDHSYNPSLINHYTQISITPNHTRLIITLCTLL
jgi:hypothetical protein